METYKDLEEVREMTIGKIEEMADMFFPIRDKDGKPSYREHQRETIIKIARAFLLDNKKFVAVDGPVGCGKSAINYAISMMMNDTVYLTPLKMLQDQIAAEKWEGVKMLKGRGAYACNHCGYEDNDIRCNYSGDEYDTCQTSKPKNNYNRNTLDIIGQKIRDVHEMFNHNQFSLRLRSSFSSHQEYESLIGEMKKFVMKEKRAFARRCNLPESSVRYEYDVEKNVACSMDAENECPAKSSRLLAKMAPIRVLNPDIFFLLTRFDNPFYSNNSLMVYDECQQIESVISRIFKVKLPLDTVNALFGMDMRHLHEIDEMSGLLSATMEYIHDHLGPAAAAAKTITRLGDICTVKNFPTLIRMKSKSSLAMKLIECAHGFLFSKWSDKKWTFSMLEVVNYAFTGDPIPEKFNDFKSFIYEVSEYFADCCERYECDQKVDIYKKLIPACKRIFHDNGLNMARKSRTRELTSHEKSDSINLADVIVPEDKIFADHINLFKRSVDPFINNVNALSSVSSDDLPAFTVARLNEPSKIACKGTALYKDMANSSYANRIEKCLEIVPIAIGRLMKAFFYKKARKVLLTSGTWVCPESLFKLYGLPKEDTEFIKIPSTFDADKRPVFVIDDKSFTNFSEKEDGPGRSYVYKTEAGTKKFTLELSSIVKRVRRYIKEEHDENANIIIHCHTFDIANKIAEFAPGVDDSYLIHLPNAGSHIENKITKHTVWAKDKNDLIQIMKDCPNSGLTIISPSISEGVDFKNDIARAQIILKRPIPYLGDIFVRSYYLGNAEIGVNRDPDFLDRVCYTTMTQMYGRIVRSVDDWGYSICLDQSITWALKSLFKRRRRICDLNIKYFWEGVQVKSDKNGNPVFSWPFG